MSPSDGGSADNRAEYTRELRQYLWGYGLAVLLTLLPFGLVNWAALREYGLYVGIGACALAQVIVHFRCFLHIDPPRQNTDDLHLILFSGLLLFFMIAGTIWILSSLAARTG
ncbi:MAG TPA: cytochrome C oxidase subunit IV family protein [Steroidobacteraceae bacterium]|nr:cytochrome C oxidase subunit IV family protein [Steroidobacteraceae bacterium]